MFTYPFMAIDAGIISIVGRCQLTPRVVARLGFCFLIALLVTNARAQPDDEDCDQGMADAPIKYLHLQQKYNYGVVYGICTVGKKGSLLLLLPLSNHGPLDNIMGGPPEPPRIRRTNREAGVPALFFYYEGCVTNAAALAIEKPYLRLIDIAQGGVPEINDFGNMARELASYPLTFVPPDKLMEVLQAKPVRQCHSSDIKK